MEEHLTIYPVVMKIPIAWGEMDAFGHVNNTAYFKYFESARILYFDQINLMEFMETTGVGPILASTQCRYKIPLVYPDQITVGARVDVHAMKIDRFTMEYTVFSHKHNKVAASGEGVLVTFNYRKNQKVPIPDEIKKRILTLEKNK